METYYWSTVEPHDDNNDTMNDYLENHLDGDSKILMVDGTYAEIEKGGKKCAVHASGNGDFFNHKVEFEEIK